jgi:transcriptional regulator with XRE-family HTH domain
MSTSLDAVVRSALEARKGEWQAIADGSGVSYSWLSKFVNGHIDNPGFGTLTKLESFLSPKPAAMKARKSKAEA